MAMLTRTVPVLLLCLAAWPAWSAGEPPRARIDIEPEQVNVGEPVRLRLTVLVPTWFTSPPVFPDLELPNAITRLPPDSSFPTSARVGRDTWSGIVRDYQVFPQLTARYELAGGVIQVRYADPETRQPVSAEITLGPQSFRAVVPAGAEALAPYLGATKLDLEQEIGGETTTLRPGDAVVRTVTARIAGMPAMFLPPLLPESGDTGLRAYAREPRVSDTVAAQTGAVTGTRVEQATYVVEQGGTFELPAITLRWWNTALKQIEETTVPAVSLIAAAPVTAAEQPPARGRRGWSWTVAGFVVVLVLAALIWRYGGAVRARMSAWQTRWRHSEGYAYRRLLYACNHGDGHEIQRRLIAWLPRLAPGLEVHDLATVPGAGALATEVRVLMQCLYCRDNGELPLDGRHRRRLRAAVRAARAAGQRAQYGAADTLPPLNPTSARDGQPL